VYLKVLRPAGDSNTN